MKYTIHIEALVIFVFLSFIASCSIMREEIITDGIKERTRLTVIEEPITKSLIQEDSLQRIIRFQTDKEFLLLHQIKCREDVFYLDLTQNEITELNIPDSLYHWATNFVECLNAE